MITELPQNQTVGVRFHPTDQELIYHYLLPKIQGKLFDDAIAEIDLCQWEPWELPQKSKITSKPEDRMWWFMCQLSYKHRGGDRLNRQTKSGFWKPTGKPRTIKDNHDKGCIGKKRTLVFHTGKSPGKRTNWVMQEYYLDPKNMPSQERASYVICRLKKKTDEKVDTPDGCEPIDDILPDHENSGPTATIQELHDQTKVNHESDWQRNLIRDFNWWETNGGHGLQMKNDDLVNEYPDEPVEVTFQSAVSKQWPSMEGVVEGSRTNFKVRRGRGVAEGMDTDFKGTGERFILEGEVLLSPRSSEKVLEMKFVNALLELQRICTMILEDTSFSNLTRPVQRSNASSRRLLVKPLWAIHQKRIQFQKNSPFATTSSNKYTLQGSYDSPRSSKTVLEMKLVNALRELRRICTMILEDTSFSNFTRPVQRSYASSPRVLVEPPWGIHQKLIQLQKNSPFATTSSNKGKEALEQVVTTTNQPQKGTLIEEFRNVGEVAERSNVKKHNLEFDKCESSLSKWKKIINLVETSSVSACISQPRSVYWFIAITGTILFGIFVRKLALFGSW